MVRIIDDKLSLIPYYRNDEVSLTWYQDIDICKQVDNMDELYNLERLHRMYDYLCEHGDCYYIQYQGQLIGDVSLLDDGAIAIVICKAYQNRQIGRRCVLEMLQLAYEKELSSVKANIYSFNRQSQKMFLAVGFRQIDEEWYEYSL
ncbi:GNAT family N-acetyltransferase [Tuanshanicoccus lijuaniae]|uniref:GNAT family N-acetyltransferase n=1 Tax=Aerococcaceae bacterium zg-1292 TaxID=2774330 RepID=UPI00193835FC|nr:GNAT family N-acetyltransferase [Aerococcaceae bacterium zg-1292]QQA36310.1 GNAT family N-acetyltransferase [Aerococcaceae bacterium zg-1292]